LIRLVKDALVLAALDFHQDVRFSLIARQRFVEILMKNNARFFDCDSFIHSRFLDDSHCMLQELTGLSFPHYSLYDSFGT
jgi:hypothetical protein